MTRPVVGIIGVGMIGASIGRRQRRNGNRVVGYDVDADALSAARAAGAVDAVATWADLVGQADVLVLSAHLGATLRDLKRLRRAADAGPALVLDVASVKAPVVRAAAGVKNFVATHPLAGGELAGAAASRADLFDGCTWAYAPTGDDALDARAGSFIRSCGGVPLAVAAEKHDAIVALTSHLPQLIATCFAALLRESEPEARQLCGPVARELLRIGGMNATMWNDVFAANAHEIEPRVRRLVDALERAPLRGGPDSGIQEIAGAQRVEGEDRLFPLRENGVGRFPGEERLAE